jgi:hypothetical protein
MRVALTKRGVLLGLWWASLAPAYVITVLFGFFVCAVATSMFGGDIDDPNYLAPDFLGNVVWAFFIAMSCAALAPARRGRVALFAGLVSLLILAIGNYHNRANLDSDGVRDVVAMLGACSLGTILAYLVISFFKMTYRRRLRLDAERALSTTSA